MSLLKKLEKKANTSDAKLWYWIKLLEPKLSKILVREHPFCKRKFRFDFAFVDEKIAIECDGGTRIIKTKTGKLTTGRHASDTDYEKRCLAAIHGWKMLAFTSNQIDKDPKKCIDYIKEIYQKWKIK